MRPSYKKAVMLIAYNDEPSSMLEEEMEGIVSVVIIASLFDKTPEKVAADVVSYRKNHSKEMWT